jgi:serine/threonine protein kinase
MVTTAERLIFGKSSLPLLDYNKNVKGPTALTGWNLSFSHTKTNYQNRSMGVILFVMVTGTLPFDEPNLARLFEKIQKAEFDNPSYLSPSVVDLIRRILEPSPKQRISIAEIKTHSWFTDEDDESDGLGATHRARHHQHQLSKKLSIPSTSEQDQIMTTILTALRDLSFAAVASEGRTIKGHKVSPRGVIGITVTVSKRDDQSFSIDIRKGRGDILEYSEELKKLLSKINGVI